MITLDICTQICASQNVIIGRKIFPGPLKVHLVPGSFQMWEVELNVDLFRWTAPVLIQKVHANRRDTVGVMIKTWWIHFEYLNNCNLIFHSNLSSRSYSFLSNDDPSSSLLPTSSLVLCLSLFLSKSFPKAFT